MATPGPAEGSALLYEIDPKLKSLEILLGEWETSMVNPSDPTQTVTGSTTFELLRGGTWLIERSEAKAPFPSSISVIGLNETTGSFAQHYFDARGVERIYEMSLQDNIWRLWRIAPGFSQQFEGTFSEDGNTIQCHWDSSEDGITWAHDFDMTYRRQK